MDLEDFIAVKGITAMGNQLTREKVLEINALEPLPYEEPPQLDARDMEENRKAPGSGPADGDQPTLF